ncbi:radical SAM/SPASM domain-containing protein [Shouchella tritolerans]|uniref:radical SAM/SPASM domain-containing protein n=1 Tax=Shouchella tritolerans TaxID=2979466 RepID=UPI0007886A65|nr:radical SAM protein [Shouchella tritolerans]
MFLRGPAHVDFNLTNGCNLACSHCHSSSGPRLDNELKTDEILEVINDLHKMGTLKIAFAGGEPFIRRDIIEILSFACNLPGWTVSVITNGLFLHERNVNLLKEKCPNLMINVSIDGSTPENYTVLRKQVNNPNFDPVPVFERVKDGVKKVVDAGFNTSINFTVTKATEQDLFDTYKLAMNLGANALVGIKFFPGGYGRKHLDKFELPFNTWAKIFSKLTKEKLSGNYEHLQISIPAPWEFYLPLIEQDIDIEQAEKVWNYRSPLRESGYKSHNDIGDILGNAELSVSSNGEVYPSVLVIGEEELECGNLRKESIFEIWKRSSILTEIRGLTIEKLEGNCRMCSLKDICGGGSRSRAYAKEKKLYAKDYMCPIVNSLRELEYV